MRRITSAALACLLMLAPITALAQPPKPAYVTGAPTTGAIAKASGPQSLTTGDLSGDCTTSATLSTICLKTNGVNFGYFATGTDAANLTGTVSVNRFNSGTSASSSTYLRGDGTWSTPPGTSCTFANPTATASDTAVNGSATTCMRSDGAPAVQKGSSSQFGVLKCDGVTATCPSGVISAATGGVTITSGSFSSVSNATINGFVSGFSYEIIFTSFTYLAGGGANQQVRVDFLGAGGTPKSVTYFTTVITNLDASVLRASGGTAFTFPFHAVVASSSSQTGAPLRMFFPGDAGLGAGICEYTQYFYTESGTINGNDGLALTGVKYTATTGTISGTYVVIARPV